MPIQYPRDGHDSGLGRFLPFPGLLQIELTYFEISFGQQKSK